MIRKIPPGFPNPFMDFAISYRTPSQIMPERNDLYCYSDLIVYEEEDEDYEEEDFVGLIEGDMQKII